MRVPHLHTDYVPTSKRLIAFEGRDHGSYLCNGVRPLTSVRGGLLAGEALGSFLLKVVLSLESNVWIANKALFLSLSLKPRQDQSGTLRGGAKGWLERCSV